jgi:hypothetical protein
MVAMRGADHADLVAAIEHYLRTTEQSARRRRGDRHRRRVGDRAEITNHTAWSLPSRRRAGGSGSSG